MERETECAGVCVSGIVCVKRKEGSEEEESNEDVRV